MPESGPRKSATGNQSIIGTLTGINVSLDVLADSLVASTNMISPGGIDKSFPNPNELDILEDEGTAEG
jgi:hypothetical protein